MQIIKYKQNSALIEYLKSIKSIDRKKFSEVKCFFDRYNDSLNIDDFNDIIDSIEFCFSYLAPITKIKGKDFNGKILDILYPDSDEEIEFQTRINNYIKFISKKSSKINVYNQSKFEITLFSDFPQQGLSTYQSIGLTDFILNDYNAIPIRLIFSITLDNTYISDDWILLLDNICDETLNNGVIPKVETTLQTDKQGINFKNDGNLIMENYLCDLGVWLDDHMNKIETEPDTFIFELIPIKNSEVKMIKKSYRKFQKAVDKNKINLLALDRA